VLRIVPYAGIKFMAYEQIKHAIMPTPKSETHLRKFLAGSLAGCTAVFFSYPLDLLRVRLAFEKDSSITKTVKAILKEEPNVGAVLGLRHFYRGFMPTMVSMRLI
jgi:solute carrier family 25 (mitochondrial carrier protein), member 16